MAQLASGAVLVGIPALLIFQQPDLGTAVTLLPVYIGIIFVAGLPMRWLVTAAVVGTLLSPVVWMYGLQDYQRERIETFLDPSNDPRGAGYQQIQAKITVGSGGLTGKGFGAGTQSSASAITVNVRRRSRWNSTWGSSAYYSAGQRCQESGAALTRSSD